MRVRDQRGSTTAEYVGIVLVVVMVFLALLVLRSTDVGRQAPVRPLPTILRLIQAPMRPLAPVRTQPSRPRPPRPRRPRPQRPAPPAVLLPPWMGGR